MLIAQESSIAQSNPASEFLQKIGLLDSLYSEILEEQRNIYIEFPAGYELSSSEKYPVVYILDGEVHLPAVDNVQTYYSGGFTPEMILIGISNAKNRTRDLTISKLNPESENEGEAANFLNFIENELIPYVEDKYPVTQFRTLIGHSYGGLFTLYTLANKPEMFSNYIAIDPSLDWDEQKLLSESGKKFLNKDFQGKSLFMSLNGQLHLQDPEITLDNVMADESNLTLFARSNIGFSHFLEQNKQNGLNYSWKFYPADLHGTVFLPSTIDGLISVFEWYQMEDVYKMNIPETSVEELRHMIEYRSKKLEKHFNYPVAPYPDFLLNVLGYMSMEREQMDKAKMYFETTIKYYPKNPGAYDAMADYYSEIKDYPEAIKNLEIATKISGSDEYRSKIELLKKEM